MKLAQIFRVAISLILLALSTHAQSWLTNGLVCFYPLNGTTADALGNGNTGTLENGAYYANGLADQPNGAVFCDGTNAYVYMGKNDSVYPSQVLTWSVWFKPASINWGRIFWDDDSSPAGDRWIAVASGDTNTGAISAGTFGAVAASPLAISLSQWHHAVFTSDVTGQYLYLDGQLVASTNSIIANHAGLSSVSIGAGNCTCGSGPNLAYGARFQGAISNVRIYNRALSASEVAQLYAYNPATNVTLLSVTNTADSGTGSLRQAILDANAAGGNATINIGANGTITLASSLPPVTGNTTITGPGTNLLTISGNNAVQIFTISGVTAQISGLTIANGLATGYANGAGICNAGNLTIQSCALLNNTNLGGWGGAVFNSGDLTIAGSSFAGNQVVGENGYFFANSPWFTGAGGGGAGMGGGLFSITGTVTITNSSFTGNGATGGNGGGLTAISSGRGGGINGGSIGSGSFPAYHVTGGSGGFGGGGGGGYGCLDGLAPTSGGQGGYGGGGGGGGGGYSGNYIGSVGGQGGFGGGNGENGNTGNSANGGVGGGGAGLGGGIFLKCGTLTVFNCLFSGNQATGGQRGSTYAGQQGNNGSGIGTDFFNFAGTILPVLNAATPGGGTVPVPVPPYLNSPFALTATPTTGWTFLDWLGDVSGTNPVVVLCPEGRQFVQAVFGTPLTVSSFVSAYPQADFYPYGTVVKLTAQPPAGFYFGGWNGSASGTNNPLSLVVTNANPSVTALFGVLNTGQYALTVIESGRGHVTANPVDNYYASGQIVTLIPVPDVGQSFTGWTGAASGTASPLVVTMSQSQTITANFTTLPSLQVGTTIDGMVDGGFRLTINGEFGAQYQVFNSTDLVTWTPLGTVTNTFGVSQFLDGNGTNAPLGFYRLMQVGQ